MKNSDINIFPNPATDAVTISLSNKLTGSETVEIYNITGKLVMRNLFKDLEGTSVSKSMNISELNTGVYFVYITGAGDSKIRKLVKIN